MALRTPNLLTLTPQAADNKLDGELEDIVHRLDTSDLDNEAGIGASVL